MKEFFMKSERAGFAVWEEGDTEDAFLLWKDPQVTRFICRDGVFSDEDVRRRLETEAANGRTYGVQYWPVYTLSSRQLIGCCGLRPFRENVYELGFHLRPQFWHQGYAKETAEAVLAYAFSVLEADAVIAGHHPENKASARVLEKLGFRYIGENYYAPTGLYHPSYEMGKDEYRERKQNERIGGSI